VGKVTLKSNGDEVLSNEFLLKSNGDEALTLIRAAGGVYDFRNFEQV
jgi:hypothetical protein